MVEHMLAASNHQKTVMRSFIIPNKNTTLKCLGLTANSFLPDSLSLEEKKKKELSNLYSSSFRIIL